jgi:hypothetical protein
MRGVLRSAAGLGLAMALASPAWTAPADGFREFWTAFTAAVAKDDQSALAKMVVLGPELDQAEPLTFARAHADLFGPAARRCLARAKPVHSPDGAGEPSYSAFCGQIIYGFYRRDGVWKLTDVGPDD